MADYSKNFLASMTGYINFDDNNEKSASDPGKGKGDPREEYYKNSAVLSYYKGLLNEKLKKKNPEAFADYFKGLLERRKANDIPGAQKYVQETPYEEYLTPDEVKKTLGEDGYGRYLDSLKQVNAYNVSQGKQPLYGSVEGEDDIAKLNYGRRFASLQVNPSLGILNQTRGTSYGRQYVYDPQSNTVSFTETGDVKLRPDYLSINPSK